MPTASNGVLGTGTAEFEMWGVAQMNPLWVYESQQVPQSRIIMLGVAHDYAAIRTAPEATAGAEVVHHNMGEQRRQRNRATQAAGAWRREMVCRLRPLSAVLQSDSRLRNLRCGMPLEPPGRRPDPRRETGPASRPNHRGPQLGLGPVNTINCPSVVALIPVTVVTMSMITAATFMIKIAAMSVAISVAMTMVMPGSKIYWLRF